MGSFLTQSLLLVGMEAELVFPNTTAALLEQLVAMDPDVVLLDLDLGRLGNATPLIAPLVQKGSEVLIFTASSDHLSHAACLEAGAAGVIAKDDSFANLCAAIRSAAAGEPVCSEETRSNLLRQLRSWRASQAQRMAPFESLTPKERQVLEALGRGMSAKTVASDNSVSMATVRSHIGSVLRKLDASSQLEAVSLATEVGWFDR